MVVLSLLQILLLLVVVVVLELLLLVGMMMMIAAIAAGQSLRVVSKNCTRPPFEDPLYWSTISCLLVRGVGAAMAP